MLEHHIQREIVNQLAGLDDARFTDLKPDDMDNNAFTYHLQKVIKAGLVYKSEEGAYELTEEGRRLGRRLADTSYSLSSKPHSVLFLIVRRKEDGAWLLYKRKTHPLKDKTGFMHATPNALASVTECAQQELQEKTGLAGEFTVIGSGFFRMYRDKELESYTQFTALYCDEAKGTLNAQHKSAEYWWQQDPDFLNQDMLPNMPLLTELYISKKLFFVDESFQI